MILVETRLSCLANSHLVRTITSPRWSVYRRGVKSVCIGTQQRKERVRVLHPYLLEQDPLRQGWGKTGISSTHISRTFPPVDILRSTRAGRHERKPLRRCAPAVIFMALSTEVPGSKRKVPVVKDHRMIEEGAQEAAIGAFLLAHAGPHPRCGDSARYMVHLLPLRAL